MRRALLIGIIVLAASSAPAEAAKKSICTNATGKQVIKQGGKLVKTLRSGQYYAFGFKGGGWTFCNTKAGVRTAFKSFNYDLSGQKYTGVRLFSRPGKCLALQLKPTASGVPAVPTVDMRPGGQTGSSVTQIDFAAPGASIVKVELSSTCLLATAYTSADGARKIQLNPIIPPNVLQETIALSDKATDADLRTLKLSGDNVSWTDAGVKQSKVYSGPPPR